MFFSLILPTYMRTDTLPRLLNSLTCQYFSDFEVIVVDQNSDDRVLGILGKYPNLSFQHLRRSPGLSRAKNAGLQYASGVYALFPDDDCWLSETLLQDIYALLQEKNYPDFLCFKAGEPGGAEVIPFARGKGWVDRYSVWRQCCAISFVGKVSMLAACGGFHLDFGLGAKWPSGEDVELPVRLVSTGYTGYYSDELVIYHPSTEALSTQEQLVRVSKYAPAAGRIWRIHRYPVFYVLYHLLRPLGGAFIAVLKGKVALARSKVAVFTGRLAGWNTMQEKNTWPSQRKEGQSD